MLSKEARMIFVKRYWQMASVKDIAKEYNISESKVTWTSDGYSYSFSSEGGISKADIIRVIDIIR